jgi:hypothetical protein
MDLQGSECTIRLIYNHTLLIARGYQYSNCFSASALLTADGVAEKTSGNIQGKVDFLSVKAKGIEME